MNVSHKGGSKQLIMWLEISKDGLMKKRNRFFFVVCLIACCIACTDKGAHIEYIEDTSLSKVLVKRALVIGIDDTMPILSFRNEKRAYVGYDIEIFTAICKRMKIRPIFYPIDWSQKETLLNNGSIDCIASGFSISAEREQRYTLVTPYLQNTQVLVALTEKNWSKLSDFAERRIGVQVGSISRDTIEQTSALASVSIVEYPDFNALCRSLDADETAGIVVDLITSYDILMETQRYTIIDEPLSAEFYTFAFRKDDKTLAAKIEAELKALDNEGVIPALSQKWFGANVSVLNIKF